MRVNYRHLQIGEFPIVGTSGRYKVRRWVPERKKWQAVTRPAPGFGQNVCVDMFEVEDTRTFPAFLQQVVKKLPSPKGELVVLLHGDVPDNEPPKSWERLLLADEGITHIHGVPPWMHVGLLNLYHGSFPPEPDDYPPPARLAHICPIEVRP